MTGLVRDEQAFFLPEANTKKPLTADDFMRYTVSYGAAHKDKLLAKYPLADYPSPSLAEIAMAQGAKACTARLLDRTWSKYVPVYAYEFADRTAPSYFPDVSYPMRAYHTSELQYLFPRFRGGQGTSHPLNEAQERLSDLHGRLLDDVRTHRHARPVGRPRLAAMAAILGREGQRARPRPPRHEERRRLRQGQRLRSLGWDTRLSVSALYCHCPA